MDIFTALVLLIVGGILGWKYREYTALKLVQEMREQEKELEQHLENTRILITVERVDGQIFAYEKESCDFLAQGDDWQSLANRLVERFPGKKFIMDEQNLKDTGFYN